MVDLHFTAHNRRAFTVASFSALLENTNFDLVNQIIITDDLSEDGTSEYLAERKFDSPVPVSIARQAFGGPVPAMNHALDQSRAPLMAKLDSDVVVCPRWLDIMLGVLNATPRLDALGMEPGFGERVVSLDEPRGFRTGPHIGGVGLFRTRVFKRRRPNMNNRWFGLTTFWQKNAACGWVTPDLPVFLLDHLPFEPWRTLAESYVVKGWSRPWPAYEPEFEPYWRWWTDLQEA